MSEPRRGTLHVDGRAGRLEHSVWILDETRQRYRVTPRFASFRLPSGRVLEWPDTALVLKTSVTLEAAHGRA